MSYLGLYCWLWPVCPNTYQKYGIYYFFPGSCGQSKFSKVFFKPTKEKEKAEKEPIKLSVWFKKKKKKMGWEIKKKVIGLWGFLIGTEKIEIVVPVINAKFEIIIFLSLGLLAVVFCGLQLGDNCFQIWHLGR